MTARPHSLRRQLWWWLVALHLVATAVTAFFSYLAYGRLIDTFMDEQMRVVAESYAGSERARAAGRCGDDKAIRARRLRDPALERRRPDAAGQLLAALALPLQGEAGFAGVQCAAASDERWRVYTARARRAGRAAARAGAAERRFPPAPRHAPRAAGKPAHRAAAAGVAAGAVADRGARARARCGVVAREIAAQDERSTDELPVARVPEEIGPLVAAFNSLLARLRGALATQRRFVQDAAHELRTPITAIGLQIENLRAPDSARRGAAERFEQLEAGVTRARHLTEQLLRLSRQDAPGPRARRRSARCAGPTWQRCCARASASSCRWPTGAMSTSASRAPGRAGGPGAGGRTAHRVRQPDRQRRALCARGRRGGCAAACAGRGSRWSTCVDNGPGIPPELIGARVRPLLPSAGRAGRRQRPGPGDCAGRGASAHGMRIELRNREGESGLLARVYLCGARSFPSH